MKRTILAIGVLMAVGSGAGAVAATRGTNVTFVVQLRGDAYVAHRQLLLAEKVEDIERADFGISKAGGLLQETLLRRKAASPFLAAFDEIVDKDRRDRQSGRIDEHALRDDLPRFAPLASSIADLRSSNQMDRVALRDVSLGVAEFFLKLANDEYETFNALCALNMLARYRETSDVLLPELIEVVERTDSARVAAQGLLLLQRPGFGRTGVETIGKAVAKHMSDKRVRTVCRAILQERSDDVAARRLVNELDEYERGVVASRNTTIEANDAVEVIVDVGDQGGCAARVITNAPARSQRP